jgi:hypothetical protein
MRPNVKPAPGPVKTLRASNYTVAVSANGRRWQTVATVTGVTRRTTDVLRFAPIRARYVRLLLPRGSQKPLRKTKTNPNPPPTTPMLLELTVAR